ncbi:MAG: hypothetical protein U0Q14_08255 [Dermatophilaceae bacterium]
MLRPCPAERSSHLDTATAADLDAQSGHRHTVAVVDHHGRTGGATG